MASKPVTDVERDVRSVQSYLERLAGKAAVLRAHLQTGETLPAAMCLSARALAGVVFGDLEAALVPAPQVPAAEGSPDPQTEAAQPAPQASEPGPIPLPITVRPLRVCPAKRVRWAPAAARTPPLAVQADPVAADEGAPQPSAAECPALAIGDRIQVGARLGTVLGEGQLPEESFVWLDRTQKKGPQLKSVRASRLTRIEDLSRREALSRLPQKRLLPKLAARVAAVLADLPAPTSPPPPPAPVLSRREGEELLRQGAIDAEVARRCRVSREAVRKWRRALGVAPSTGSIGPRKAKPAKKSQGRQCEACGRPSGTRKHCNTCRGRISRGAMPGGQSGAAGCTP